MVHVNILLECGIEHGLSLSYQYIVKSMGYRGFNRFLTKLAYVYFGLWHHILVVLVNYAHCFVLKSLDSFVAPPLP